MTDQKAVEQLIAYLNGELDTNETSALEKRLLEEEDLRCQLLEISIEESALTDWARTEQRQIKLEDKVFENVDLHDVATHKDSRIPVLAGWWAAAAILIVSGVGFFVAGKENSPQRPVLGVAQVIASIDAEWQDPVPSLNAPLTPGAYQLRSGSIDLLFADGARVSVSGPALFNLRSSRHIHLESGNLVARIPDEALGFIVTSPRSEVVDLGTEFGLSVDGNGLTDVHVIDGLVEVLPLERESAGHSSGVMIGQGEARRFSPDPDTNATSIPVSSRAGLIGQRSSREIGLDMLRGSVQVVDRITKNDLFEVSEGPNWIDLAVEQREVLIEEPLTVSIDAPGSYRSFVNPEATLPSGQRVNSYLLHFRPNSFNHVSGVIRFDQPIVAILCTGQHLRQTDALFGVSSVYYPTKANDFQGLEPNGSVPGKLQNPLQPWEPDEIIFSHDRRAISIRTFAGVDRGYDQIRILTATEFSD